MKTTKLNPFLPYELQFEIIRLSLPATIWALPSNTYEYVTRADRNSQPFQPWSSIPSLGSGNLVWEDEALNRLYKNSTRQIYVTSLSVWLAGGQVTLSRDPLPVVNLPKDVVDAISRIRRLTVMIEAHPYGDYRFEALEDQLPVVRALLDIMPNIHYIDVCLVLPRGYTETYMPDISHIVHSAFGGLRVKSGVFRFVQFAKWGLLGNELPALQRLVLEPFVALMEGSP